MLDCPENDSFSRADRLFCGRLTPLRPTHQAAGDRPARLKLSLQTKQLDSFNPIFFRRISKYRVVGHHSYVTGMQTLLDSPTVIASLLVILPTAAANFFFSELRSFSTIPRNRASQSTRNLPLLPWSF